MNIINLYENYNYYFNADLKAIFEQCSKIAAKNNFKLYLIGGMVRDLLIATCTNANEITASVALQPPRNDADVDITIEGDAIKFAQILKKEINAKILSIHESFGTVKVDINGQKIDLASTRSESYPQAGHLPHVDKIGCSLKADVVRRDFTVNALALSLNQENFADLIDYIGGFEDLKAKKIRVLHDRSFIDDPTRIIRALKYSSRLGFEIDEKTLKLQEDYLQNINYDMCYKRVKQEIKKTFEQNSQRSILKNSDFSEKSSFSECDLRKVRSNNGGERRRFCFDTRQEAFEKFIEQKIYKLITQKELKIPKTNIENLIKKHTPKHPWVVFFGILAVMLNIELSPTNYEKEVIEGAKNLLKQHFKDDFEIYKAFNTQKLETLLILAALGKEKKVCHYLNDLAKIKLHINGDDLIKLGFKPSKKFSEAFDYVLKEKLKKPSMTKAEEIKLAKKYLLF